MTTEALDRAVDVLTEARRILVFTGAGVSTESGIPDFRGPEGLWTKVDPDDFTIERYVDRSDVRAAKWRMHARGELWGARSDVKPNAAHYAIVEMERINRLSGVVTQNIDGLHRAAGLDASRVAEVHGDVRTVRCMSCDYGVPIEVVLARVDEGEEDPDCPDCSGILKTSTVMFGEMLPEVEMAKAWTFADAAEAVLVVGSTVGVYPVAAIPTTLAARGVPLVIVNRGATEVDFMAAVRVDGSAGEAMTAIAAALS